MTKTKTMYDEVGDVLMEFAVLVVGVAEIPSMDLETHRAKFKAVMDLKEAARSVMIGLIEKKIVVHENGSIN